MDNYVEAHAYLGAVLQLKGKDDDARDELVEALRQSMTEDLAIAASRSQSAQAAEAAKNVQRAAAEWNEVRARLIGGPDPELGWETLERYAAIARGEVTRQILAAAEQGGDRGRSLARKAAQRSGIDPPGTEFLTWGAVLEQGEAYALQPGAALDRRHPRARAHPDPIGFLDAVHEVPRHALRQRRGAHHDEHRDNDYDRHDRQHGNDHSERNHEHRGNDDCDWDH